MKLTPPVPALHPSWRGHICRAHLFGQPAPPPAGKIVYFEQNGRFGAQTESGEIIVPAQYDSGLIREHGETAEGKLLFMDIGRAVRGRLLIRRFSCIRGRAFSCISR
ncbi:hypothetical protein [Eikenella longinqua]|uniref:hypothetical protein n=1 Tax=Eikenella longinqua TaxID=1795827 RepID=UPI0015D09ECB|nr:hypothetical protein [Eikenella longinqua]